MPRSESTTVDAGGRELRVTSPDRVIFPATERTAAVTKLDVVEYYLAVSDGIMRALDHRPTTLERWPKGVHEGIVLSTREKGGGDAFFQKRIPQGAPDYVHAVRVAAQARVLLNDIGYVGFPKTSGGRGVHIYVRIEPRWTFTDVRH